MFVEPSPMARKINERCSDPVYISAEHLKCILDCSPSHAPSGRRTVPRPEHPTKYLHTSVSVERLFRSSSTIHRVRFCRWYAWTGNTKHLNTIHCFEQQHRILVYTSLDDDKSPNCDVRSTNNIYSFKKHHQIYRSRCKSFDLETVLMTINRKSCKAWITVFRHKL